MKPAPVLAAIAVVFAVAASGFLLFADTYSGQSCTAGLNSLECVETSATLVEQNGNGALLLLAIPVALSSAVLAMVLLSAPTSLPWAVAVSAALLCTISIVSIGILYLPVVLALIGSAVLYRRPEPQPR